MRSTSNDAMTQLEASIPMSAEQTTTFFNTEDEDQLLAKIMTSREPVLEKGPWGRMSRRARSIFVGLSIATLAAGGGLAVAATNTSSNHLTVAKPTYTKAQRRVIYANELKLATCMHSHGYPTFPDPNPNLGNGRTPVLEIGGPDGGNIDVNSPSFQSARDLCSVGMQRVPGNLPSRAFPSTQRGGEG